MGYVGYSKVDESMKMKAIKAELEDARLQLKEKNKQLTISWDKLSGNFSNNSKDKLGRIFLRACIQDICNAFSMIFVDVEKEQMEQFLKAFMVNRMLPLNSLTAT